MSDQLTIRADVLAVLPQPQKAVHRLWKSAIGEMGISK